MIGPRKIIFEAEHPALPPHPLLLQFRDSNEQALHQWQIQCLKLFWGPAHLHPKIKGGPGIISWPCRLQFELKTKVRDWGAGHSPRFAIFFSTLPEALCLKGGDY